MVLCPQIVLCTVRHAQVQPVILRPDQVTPAAGLWTQRKHIYMYLYSNFNLYMMYKT